MFIKYVLEQIAAGRTARLGSLWGSAPAYFLARLRAEFDGGLIVIAPDQDSADWLIDDLKTFLSGPNLKDAQAKPGPDDSLHHRLSFLNRLGPPARRILIFTPDKLFAFFPDPETLKASAWRLHQGQRIEPSETATRLSAAGYEESKDPVSQPGQFSRRGGLLDLFPLGLEHPLRIEWNGPTISSLRIFNPDTQLSIKESKEAAIPMPKALAVRPKNQEIFIIKHLGPETLLGLVNLPEKETDKIINSAGTSRVVRLDRAPAPDGSGLNPDIGSLQRFSSGFAGVISELDQLAGRSKKINIFSANQAEQARLQELLKSNNFKNLSRLSFRQGRLSEGFCLNQDRTAFISHRELFNRYRQLRQTKPAGPSPSKSGQPFWTLKRDDFAVHSEHGIGRYIGLKRLYNSEFMALEYLSGGTGQDRSILYVPVSQFRLVGKYWGADSRSVRLDRLGGNLWTNRREKVKNAVLLMARELLYIQALRLKKPGFAFPEDTEWQSEFEQSFPYEDTSDQTEITAVIKSDMESPRPMDRLICGDVGYGKTELAARAAFKAALAGKQVALIAPTTILAQQHRQTFSERMSDYPFQIEVLSRFRSPAEQSEIIKKISAGKIDIIIGTHRLIQPDITFKDLGLVIIDEEQRFGVEHKEFFKKLKSSVDVLTLSATPIPRTLHLALAGLREISTMTVPPQDRRAIQTRILNGLSGPNPGSEEIRRAIRREIARKGQIYFVHNRIYDIDKIARRLEELVPELAGRLCVAHGRMPGPELEQKMREFVEGRYDILVSTNIIESGLDIPKVNTIFINNAHDFGLSDLHQLRGRVGRYKHQAYAYFLITAGEIIGGDALKRLKAIEEFNELGAGFKIAMRDMEIRGIGNILGKEQHGHIAAVGYELYCKLIEQAVKRLKGGKLTAEAQKPPSAQSDAVIPAPAGTQRDRAVDTKRIQAINTDAPAFVIPHQEIPADTEAYIPESYMASESERLETYRKLAASQTKAEATKLEKEVRDRFGSPMPEPARNLFGLFQKRNGTAETLG